MNVNFTKTSSKNIKKVTKIVDIKQSENLNTQQSKSATPPKGCDAHTAPPPSQIKSEHASEKPTQNQTLNQNQTSTKNQTSNQSQTSNQNQTSTKNQSATIYTQEKSPFEMLNTSKK